MNHKEKFENWFTKIHKRADGEHPLNIKAYLSYINSICKDIVMNPDVFYSEENVTKLKSLHIKLEDSTTFSARSDPDKNNLRSGLNTYIEFMKYMRDK
jgi:hypothetical protein